MTVSSRLALAMVVLVVVTSCVVSAFACYFVAEAPPHGALTAIISAALAGGAVASVFAIALAVGITNGLRKPSFDVTGAAKAADVARSRSRSRSGRIRRSIDNEKMARAIIEDALDAFVQTDGCCVVLNWSPHAEALMGWTREEAVGRSVEELVFPESQRAVHRQWVDRFLSEAAGEAAGGRYETPLLHKDGSEFFAEVSLTALRRNEGYIINAFVRDITAKRAAEEQLFQAQKMESVGQLTGGIAHDFNNMLTVITGTIEILADGVKHDPALASIARMIDDAADRASQLTANLLAFARKQPLRPLETDVNALIEEVVKLLSPTLGRQIEIETALNDQAWPALVDRSQLSSALVNLAINARDAMPDGGRLLFRTGNFTRHERDAEMGGLGAGDYVVIEVHRFRHRHSRRHTRQDFRAVLFDQAVRGGYRARTEHGVRVCKTVRRRHRGRQRGGQGRLLSYLSAEGGHRTCRNCLRRAMRGRRAMKNCAAGRKPSCAWRMTTSCARMSSAGSKVSVTR